MRRHNIFGCKRSTNAIAVQNGTVAKFIVSGPSAANPGTSFNIAVTAQDAYGNNAIDYTGTVHFTSSDGSATLPANYAFVSSDQGSRDFSAILATAGSQTISVNDVPATTITGTTSPAISVNASLVQYSQPLLTSTLQLANNYEFVYMEISAPASTAFPANAFLEFDEYMPSSNSSLYGGIDMAGPNVGNPNISGGLRDYQNPNYIVDQNGIRVHPSMDLSNYTNGQWYHRKFDISSLFGISYNELDIAQDTGNGTNNGAASNKAGASICLSTT